MGDQIRTAPKPLKTLEAPHNGPHPRNPETGARASADADAVVVNTPLTPRNLALTSIAIVTGTAGLWFAQAILIPIVLAVFISYALDPFQRRLVKWRVPQALAAAVLLGTILAGFCGGAFMLRNQMGDFLAQLPIAAQKVRAAVHDARPAGPGPMAQVQQAADELRHAATEASGNPQSTGGVTRVQLEQPGLPVTDLLWRGTLSAVEIAGQVILVLALSYYLLASGDLFKRKLVKMTGATLSDKKLTVEVLNEIDTQIASFLVVRAVISGIVTVATSLAFWGLGLHNPVVWGVLAGVLNVIPYVGPALVAGGAGVAGFLQFGTLTMVGVAAGTAVLIATLEGLLITPWLMGRAGSMNAAAVFIGLSFLGWIWGIWGLLLAVPIMMAVKAICDHVEDLKPIGEMLAD
jgi:predicted PurR-regulated permease PerM